MRIILLRFILSWWMIPIGGIILFTLGYLLVGYDETVEMIKEFADATWNGM